MGARIRRVVRYGIITSLLVLVVAAVASLAVRQLAIREARQDFPPPGRLTELEGRLHHLHCAGEGTATVVFESGLDDRGSWGWSALQEDLARITRVCSYDRAGMIWSEAGRDPRYARRTATELHALLSAASDRAVKCNPRLPSTLPLLWRGAVVVMQCVEATLMGQATAAVRAWLSPLTFDGTRLTLRHRLSMGRPARRVPAAAGAPGERRLMAKQDILRGTLDLLVLKALSGGAAHGHGVARWIEQATDYALAVGEGTLYPALHRLEERRLVTAKWGVSENNRRAKYYVLTSRGRAQFGTEMENWCRYSRAVFAALEAPAAEVGG
jgi:PadR family transcriptional regulator, regulatory protein PadR